MGEACIHLTLQCFTDLDLAAATLNGCSSEMTPFPMGVGRKGSLHLSTNSRRGFSACPYAAPNFNTRTATKMCFEKIEVKHSLPSITACEQAKCDFT